MVREIFLLYHSLSFVVTRCYSLPLVILFVVTRITTGLSFYKWSLLSTVLSSSKFTKLCLFIHFRWIDVKSNRYFGGFSLISIILWDYCEKNIKMFWYYSYENKRIISRRVVRLIYFFFEIIRSVPTNRIMFILIRIYFRIS